MNDFHTDAEWEAFLLEFGEDSARDLFEPMRFEIGQSLELYLSGTIRHVVEPSIRGNKDTVDTLEKQLKAIDRLRALLQKTSFHPANYQSQLDEEDNGTLDKLLGVKRDETSVNLLLERLRVSHNGNQKHDLALNILLYELLDIFERVSGPLGRSNSKDGPPVRFLRAVLKPLGANDEKIASLIAEHQSDEDDKRAKTALRDRVFAYKEGKLLPSNEGVFFYDLDDPSSKIRRPDDHRRKAKHKNL